MPTQRLIAPRPMPILPYSALMAGLVGFMCGLFMALWITAPLFAVQIGGL